jgi:diguanylate cyclase (GGDEF)-like protein
VKIEGLFLASRAGRRIFWTLMLAATVPIALLGASTYDALNEHFAAQAHRQRTQATKYAGLTLLDNLLVARTVLGVFARTGVADKESLIGNRRGRVLVSVAGGTLDGELLAGDARLWQQWQRAVRFEWPTSGGTSVARLVTTEQADASGPSVLMAVRLPEQPQRIWVGKVDTAYLFGELATDATGEKICVLSAREYPLYCLAPELLNEQRAARAGEERPWLVSWNLFLRSDFGTDDWTLVNLSPVQEGLVPGGMSLAKTTLLGTLATVLIVIGLSMVQVRRTMVPLEQLTHGTRRMSLRDYAVRVPQDANDEFGELARSFNDMAERIGSQVEALQVQSSIDREILDGINLERILQQVVRRIAHLLPHAEVAIVEFDRAAQTLARVHRAEGAVGIVSLPYSEIADMDRASKDGGRSDGPAPAWAPRVLRQPALRAQLLNVRSGEELLALILIAGGPGIPEADEATREITELRDRVGVALASADRERRLVERATSDSLTGLANRAGLLEHLAARLTGDQLRPCSLLFIDLDRFKEINDTFGHQAGDEVLRAVAARLRAAAPGDALVSRPSGDEFVVVVDGERADADLVAQAIVAQVAAPIALDARVVTVGASIGIARHPDHAGTAADLLRRADVAMYRVKARGGNGANWFEETGDPHVTNDAAMRADLRGALARGEFELHYQPRVGSDSGRMRSAEGLLRWRHRTLGLVAPNRFIHLLEDGGLIDDVGVWAIGSACRQLVVWRAQGIALDAVAVNVSTRQLHAPAFADRVIDILRRCQLPASSLELEITESVFMGEASAAIAQLQALHDAGVRLALDDFGTGYSSLSYLHKLPISTLKVDRSFVADLDVRDSALALTRSIVALARALQLHVVAEGVETERQAELLRGLGCDELQGYLYSRPLPADQLAAYAARDPARLQWAELTP